MKIHNSLFILSISILALSCKNMAEIKEIEGSQLSDAIRLNQVGYFPDLEKHFTVADSTAGEFKLVSEKGEVIYRGKLEDFGTWEPSGEYLKTGDFSDLDIPGKYFINVPGVGNSYPFMISAAIYRDVSVASLETFYFMRVSMDMEEKYLGKFTRPMGHPDDTVYYHESTGHKSGFRASPGGWYDAGDYGKYVVNASISTGTMLALHEIYPDAFPDGSLDIPENENGVNDLLDELRYEFDWILTMQDYDGGVFHKLTPMVHDGVTMPHETHSKRFFIGKSTAASLDFAAMLAQASRLYHGVDPEFAETCLEAAIKAYKWAYEHPDQYFFNPPGNNTGGYGDRILDEEFFWANAELYCTTGEQSYYDKIAGKLGKIRFRLEESWRNYVDNIGYYSLYMSDKLDENDRQVLEKGILVLADSLALESEKNPYGIPFSRFVWGSNSDVLNTAIIEMFAHRISGKKFYMETAARITDYIFGCNATSYSFVSGFGSKYSRNFHHRLLMADENEDTFPGFIAGGPNGFMHDRRNVEQAGVSYPSTFPAKVYIDHEASYASNEVCINWNAPLVFVLTYLDLAEF